MTCVNEVSQFYLPLTCSSASEMSHTCLYFVLCNQTAQMNRASLIDLIDCDRFWSVPVFV